MRTFYQEMVRIIDASAIVYDPEGFTVMNVGNHRFIAKDNRNGSIRFVDDGGIEILRMQKSGPEMEILNVIFKEALIELLEDRLCERLEQNAKRIKMSRETSEAEKRLAEIIRKNFNKCGVSWIQLTYRKGEYTNEVQARSELDKYIRRTNKLYKKSNCEMKYVTGTNFNNKEVIHNLILNREESINSKELCNKWPHGLVTLAPLDKLDDPQKCREVANIMIGRDKETEPNKGESDENS